MDKRNAVVREKVSSVRRGAWQFSLVIGGVAALVAAVVFRRWLNAEYALLHNMGVFHGGPQSEPTAIADWFKLLHENSVVGVLYLNAFDLINYALVGLIFLGFVAALRNLARRAVIISTTMAFLGIVFFYLSNQAFALLSLSRGYYAATTDLERMAYLSAGQALVTTSNPMVFGTGVFWAFIMVTTAGVIVSVAMIRTAIFPKATGYVGLVANALGLGYFVTVAVDPPLTFIPLSSSAPFLMVWYILVGIRLLKLSRQRTT
jgi:hypothetical protein